MTDVVAVLKAVAPRANPQFVAASGNLGSIFDEYGIVSVSAQAMVISQCAHECAGYSVFQEGLSYSAQRLCEVWPNRFPTLAAAEPFARNPKALANKVYNGRMGNRAGTDDGYDFRGSGPLQHTGRSEFDRVQRRTALMALEHPDMLRDPAHADAMWRAACTFIIDRGALVPANAGNVEAVTFRVNGGRNGLADRRVLYTRTMAAFDGTPLPKGKTTLEQADDAKRKAKQATTGAAAGGPATGGGSKQAGADASTAIAIGAVVMVALVVVAVIFWRRHATKRAEEETMRLKAMEARSIATV